MKKLWKRNAVVGAMLVLVIAAIVLNGRYAETVEQAAQPPEGKVLGQAAEVVAGTEDAAEVAAEEPEAAQETAAAQEPSDYFATARLSRQQARDSALSLLQQAGESEEMDENVADEVAQGIEALAGYTMTEAQIENMVMAKGYDDCVVFLSSDSVSVVVSSQTDGLQTEDIARITDIVKQETGLPASAIKILEVN
ncbi:MAG: SpoIIIAH-like family protein [Ruminococcaceae bacterium]|nr:SpoIIIAH-like family protein [Oscillospiraceae bacterium]